MVRFDRKLQTGVTEFNTERHLSPQLTRQIRSHKDLQGINWRICKELDAGNAEMNKEKKTNLDEDFFLIKWWGTNMQETNARTQRNTRELHLELVGDKVTYVRVYWLRSQVGSLDHRSYSLFKLKMGLPFSFKHLDVFTSCRVALTHDLE